MKEKLKMEIEIKQSKLNKALKIVSRIAANSRTTLPILNNVLIDVENKKASLVSTNLDMAIVNYIPVSSSKDGKITVPARLFSEFIDILPNNQTVKLISKNNKLVASTDKYNSTINGVSAEDFPELPELNEKEAITFKIDVDSFSQSLSEVINASSNDMTRPALTGVYFNTFEGNLYIAATDGYRLADKKIVTKVKNEVQAIVPTSSLQEVLRCIDDESKDIEIVFDDVQVRFRMNNIEITSKLIDGSYPDYRQLIPKNNDITIDLEKEEFIRVVKLAALFAREVGGSIICKTDAKKSILTVASVVNEFGENTSDIKVDANKDVKVTLNARYLLDALNAMESSKITMGFSNTIDPVVLRNKAKPEDYTHIIMPLKSNS